MALELDARQRAMLQDMGVTVWMPAAVRPQSLRPNCPACQRIRLLPRQPASHAERGAGPTARPFGGSGTGARPAVCVPDAKFHPVGPALARGCGGAAGGLVHCGRSTRRRGKPRRSAFHGPVGAIAGRHAPRPGAQRQGQGVPPPYLSNVVKCHPAPGRVAQVAELAACAPYLNQELAWCSPRWCWPWGGLPTQLLLQEHQAAASLPLGKQRGTVYRYRGLPV